MPILRDAILRLMPKSWRTDAQRDSRLWLTTCNTCGNRSNIWDLGGMRWRAYGKPVTMLRCPVCDRSRMHKLAKE